MDLIQDILADDFELEMTFDGDIFPMPMNIESEDIKPNLEGIQVPKSTAHPLFGQLIFEKTVSDSNLILIFF